MSLYDIKLNLKFGLFMHSLLAMDRQTGSINMWATVLKSPILPPMVVVAYMKHRFIVVAEPLYKGQSE